MLLIGIQPKQVFAMQLSIAIFNARSRDSRVGQSAITVLIIQNLDFSLKIHKRGKVKQEMDSRPQHGSQAALNHKTWYIYIYICSTTMPDQGDSSEAQVSSQVLNFSNLSYYNILMSQMYVERAIDHYGWYGHPFCPYHEEIILCCNYNKWETTLTVLVLMFK